MAKTWTDDKLDEFRDMLTEFGATLIYRNGQIANCLKSPDSKTKTMMLNAYKEEIKSTFDLAGTDFDALQMEDRARFTCNQKLWEVTVVRDDRPQNPVVQFDAIKQN